MTEADRPPPYHFRSSSSRAVHGSTSIIHKTTGPGRPLEPTAANGLAGLSSWRRPLTAGRPGSFFSSLLFPTNARRCYRASRLVLTRRANWSQRCVCGPTHYTKAAGGFVRALPSASQQPPFQCPPSTLHSAHAAATQPNRFIVVHFATIPASLLPKFQPLAE